jgi:hypothetical protein
VNAIATHCVALTAAGATLDELRIGSVKRAVPSKSAGPVMLEDAVADCVCVGDAEAVTDCVAVAVADPVLEQLGVPVPDGDCVDDCVRVEDTDGVRDAELVRDWLAELVWVREPTWEGVVCWLRVADGVEVGVVLGVPLLLLVLLGVAVCERVREAV